MFSSPLDCPLQLLANMLKGSHENSNPVQMVSQKGSWWFLWFFGGIGLGGTEITGWFHLLSLPVPRMSNVDRAVTSLWHLRQTQKVSINTSAFKRLRTRTAQPSLRDDCKLFLSGGKLGDERSYPKANTSEHLFKHVILHLPHRQ